MGHLQPTLHHALHVAISYSRQDLPILPAPAPPATLQSLALPASCTAPRLATATVSAIVPARLQSSTSTCPLCSNNLPAGILPLYLFPTVHARKHGRNHEGCACGSSYPSRAEYRCRDCSLCHSTHFLRLSGPVGELVRRPRLDPVSLLFGGRGKGRRTRPRYELEAGLRRGPGVGRMAT